MSSACRRAAGGVLAAALAAPGAAACDRGTPPPAAAGAYPAVQAAVGPPPGPDPATRVASNPFAGRRAAEVEGRRLFVWYNCAGCHGDHGGGGMGPSLRDPVWIYGSAEAQIFSSIAEGRAHGMPSWGTKLPSEQIWKLVTYIKTLRTPAEPDPPPENLSWPTPRPEASRGS